MRGLSRTALALVLLLQWGCSAANRPGWLHEPGWNKPWTYRAGVAAGVCALLGAGAGIGIQEARRATTCVTVEGTVVCGDDPPISDPDSGFFWLWGALIGSAAGFVLCGLLGHVFLDPPTPTPYVPPPPPPPEPTPAPPPPVKQRIVLRGVNFDFNSSDVRPSSRPVLDQAAELLKANPSVDVRVEGHTDAIGSDEYNQALSVRRAESVFRYLVNQGVDPERFTVEGFGKSHPIATNETEAGRAQNRRVELIPKQ